MSNPACRTSRLPSAPEPAPKILVPFVAAEACSIEEAAAILGVSSGHARRTVARLGIGRRVLGGAWRVSRVALAAAADGDQRALELYLAGKHDAPEVAVYYTRLALQPPRRAA